MIFIPSQAPARWTTPVRPCAHTPSTSPLTPALADDDNAVSVLATLLNRTSDAAFFRARALTAPFTIFNNATGFMEARNASGAWAGQDAGWTEGDMWAYTFDVVHDVPGLIARRGGNESFVWFLDQHFDGGERCFPSIPGV